MIDNINLFGVSIDSRTENLSQVQPQEYIQAVAPKRSARIAKIQSEPSQDYGRPKRATKPSALTKTPYTQEKKTKRNEGEASSQPSFNLNLDDI